MLCKEVCKKCCNMHLETWGKGGILVSGEFVWGDSEDHDWKYTKSVFCPPKFSRATDKRRCDFPNYNLPPKFCPYKLEHAMSAGMTKK